MTSVEEQLHRYASAVAGPPAHAEAPDDTDEPSRLPRAILAIALTAFVVLGGLAVVKAQDHRRNDTSPSATEPPPSDTSPSATEPPPSTEELQRAESQLLDALDAGFSPYRFEDPDTGQVTVGYLSIAPNDASLAPLYDQQQKRAPVFIEPRLDSAAIGYDYSWIGFVPAAVADSGTFDPAATRIAKYGCDPLGPTDAEAAACQQQIAVN